MKVNGIDVTYTDQGTGASLVLVHGHPFDHTMWAPQIEAFAGTDWRVVAADLRGYGKSTVVPGITYLSTFAEDLAALLDQLGLDQIVLGGLSMGGQIVMEFHRLFPERVRALILADTFAQGETPEGHALRNAYADRIKDSTLAVVEGTAHMPNLEKPAEFNRILGEFLARL